MPPTIETVALAVSILLIFRLLLNRMSQLPLPPGPKGLPIVGSVYDVPTEQEWVYYRDLGRRYSEHSYTHLACTK